jgi:UDPglucose 6-dehydrogenase
VTIHDPKALDNARRDLQDCAHELTFEDDPYKAAKGAHAIAILTEWRCFRELDFERIYADMEKPAFIFDGRNILPTEQLFEIGFNVYPIGREPLTHF